MNIALSTVEVFNLRDHLSTRKYEVMYIRRTFKTGTLLGAFALVDGNILGMLSFGPNNYLEIKVVLENGKLAYEVLDLFENPAMKKRFESWLGRYIGKRIEQERQWDTEVQKFGPRYSPGEVYLRRMKKSVRSHLLNIRRAAKSRLLHSRFAERLADLNLVVRFKPKP